MKDGIKNIRTIKAIRGERLIIDLNTTFEGSLQAWMKRDVDSPFYRSFEIKDNRYLILTKDKACDYVNNSGEIIEDISGKWYFDVEQNKAGISPEYSKTIYKGTILFQGDITGSNATEITEPLPQNSFLGLKDTPNTYEKSGQIVVVNETKDGLVYADTALLSFKEKQALLEHLGRYDNPHKVTKSQVGLSNVDDTSDLDKPISNDVQSALNEKSSTASLSEHKENISNPHNVTKKQVGLSNVDNTSDLEKPVSEATKELLNSKASKVSLTQHKTDISNPHSVTKSQVGLSNVDNTSDLEKPVSNDVQSALNEKSSTASLSEHKENISNPHNVTKSQVGLGSVNNTSDINKPVSNDVQNALNKKADLTLLKQHENNTLNPHDVSKGQVGLGNVDNTSDINKPISKDVEVALVLKASNANLSQHKNNTLNPHFVTKSQVGLSNVDNTSDKHKPISDDVQVALDTKALDSDFTRHKQSKMNPHSVTKSQVGLSNADNTSDIDKPVSRDVKAELDKKALDSELSAVKSSLNTVKVDLNKHKDTTTNPHFVTKSQVGLSYVDNTSDVSKPVSDLTRLELSKKASKESLIQHKDDFHNPHKVTKTLIGLSNVDNTHDADKPVSNDVQIKLDEKLDETDFENHVQNYVNPHQVNKAQVGLSNVDNTSDIGKPISNDVQTALGLKVPFNASSFTETEKAEFREEWGIAGENGDSGKDFEMKKLSLRSSNGRIFDIESSEDGIHNTLSCGESSSGFRFYNRLRDNLMSISGVGDVTANSFSPFTGCHIVPDTNQNFKIGELVCIEQYKINDIPQFTSKMQPDWRANYCEKNKKGIFGIVYSHNIEPIMEDYKSDRLNEAGEYIVKQKQVGEKREYAIACLGDMPIIANDENGAIDYGDNLTVSHKVGEACKAVGDDVVVGIAGCSFNFKKQKSVKIGMTKE